MDPLKSYLNSLTRADQEAYAAACNTSLGYLRKAISTGQRLGVELVVRLHINSGGKANARDIRPDVDWDQFNLISPPRGDEAA
ncbi:hypothetical protein GCM10011533_30150 [Streptosporangium jomthongense]|nr:hypothetical protein GCM10011533_30150 [Streptosporangium jomthongense]